MGQGRRKPPHCGRKKFCRRAFGARRQRQKIRSDWPLARRPSAARQGSSGEACLDGRFTLPLTDPAAEGWWVCVAGRVQRVRVQPGAAPACGTCFDPWRGPPPLPDQQLDPARSSFVLSHTVPGFAGSRNGSQRHHAWRARPVRGRAPLSDGLPIAGRAASARGPERGAGRIRPPLRVAFLAKAGRRWPKDQHRLPQRRTSSSRPPPASEGGRAAPQKKKSDRQSLPDFRTSLW